MKMPENQEGNKGKKSKTFDKKEWRRRKYSKKYKRKFHWCSTWFSTQTLIALDKIFFIRIFVNEFRPEWQAEGNCTSLLSIIFFSLARQAYYMIYVEVLKMVYFAYVHSIIKYGIILLGNSTTICRVFALQKRIINCITKENNQNYVWRRSLKLM